MSAVSEGSVLQLKRAFDSEAAPSTSRRKTPSPLTLRLTIDERAKLEELAAGMTLSAYVRACVFAGETKRRKRRPKDVVEDKKAIAEVLALLGQSRIASNLNQLAHHANLGVLDMGDEEKAQIAEANAHLRAIRGLLVQALGSNR
ncbi:MAG: plasmid mobilization relaxosome protein MobC [Pseudomonadota bacterium]